MDRKGHEYCEDEQLLNMLKYEHTQLYYKEIEYFKRAYRRTSIAIKYSDLNFRGALTIVDTLDTSRYRDSHCWLSYHHFLLNVNH